MLQEFEKISGYDRYHKGKENYQKRNVWDKNAKEIDDLFPDLFEIYPQFPLSQIHFSAIGLFPFADTTAKGFTCADSKKSVLC